MQRMLALKALRAHLYGTRRLEAGDEYEAPALEAIAHVANRRADFVKGRRKPAVVAPVVEAVSAVEEQAAEKPKPESIEPELLEQPVASMTSGPSLDDLRLQATALGIDVDGRWGRARLQYEIEQAQRR